MLQFDFLAAGKSKEALVASLRNFAPDVICLSLRNIDNVDSFSKENGWYLAQAKELTEIMRENSDAPIIVGGPAFTVMPEAILDYLGAEYGVVGEGEQLICNLVENLAAGRSVPRLSDGQLTPLTAGQMGSPLYEQNLVDFYQAESGQINLQTKRGCPYQCVYCTYPSLEGNRFRPQDVTTVIDDIAKAQRDYGIDNFFLPIRFLTTLRGIICNLPRSWHGEISVSPGPVFSTPGDRPCGITAVETRRSLCR